MEDMISFLLSDEFENMVNAFFGIIWLCLSIFAIFITLRLLRYLTKKEEVSMVSFLLEPQKTFYEIKLLFNSTLLFFIGTIFAFPSHFYEFTTTEPFLLLISLICGTTVMASATLYAITITFIVFRWLRRFKKYA
ncbi:MAG: hypothetical protein QXQ69_01240 [Candidatus Aenigmatarchaeota archaeon]